MTIWEVVFALSGFVTGVVVMAAWQLNRDTKRRAAKEAKRHDRLGLCTECEGSGVIRTKDSCDFCSGCGGGGMR